MTTNPRAPIKDAPLRSPGQSLEDEKRKLWDQVEGPFYFTALLCAMAVVEWMRAYTDMPPSPIAFTAAAAMAGCFLAYRLCKAIPRVRLLTQGLLGEKAVGQFLDRLQAKGYLVYHDIPGEGFNIDHVLVGPAGVYTIETKTWTKPSPGRAHLRFDGRTITRPNGKTTTEPVQQALAQAAWLKRELSESIGKDLNVFSVVAFPGWYIDQPRSALKDIWILEPKALVKFLARQPPRLDPTGVRLIGYFLSRYVRGAERARLT